MREFELTTTLGSNCTSRVVVRCRLSASPPEYFKMPVAKAYKIGSLTAQSGSVDLTVSVLVKGAPQEIKRSTGESVKVSRLLIADETGIVSLSLWDDKANLVNDLEVGGVVELRGVVARDRLGEVMLSLGRSGELRRMPGEQVGVRAPTKLNTLQSVKGLVVVEGDVADAPLARQVVTEKGESINLVSFTLRDDTAASRVTFWREQVDLVSKLRPGSRVRILGLRVRTGLGGDFELSSIPLTRVELLGEEAKEKPAWEDIRHIIALQPGLSTWVKGVVLEAVGPARLVAVCETCGTSLKVHEGASTCEKCNAQRTGRLVFEGRLRIDDGTGVAEVTITDVEANNLLPNESEIKSQMLMKGENETNLNVEQISVAIGKEIEVYGTATQKDDQGRFEIVTKKVLHATKV